MNQPLYPQHLAAKAIVRRPLRAASQRLPLEQRFMFDGAVADAAHAAQAHDVPPPPIPPAVTVRAADPSKDDGKKEVALIDTSVADYKTLEAGVRDGVGIVEFDGSSDGLAQIAQWAAGQSGLDAIHILSHGSEGIIDLGTELLTDASLSSASTQAELAQLGQALNADGDLLLYGCDVAAGPHGEALLDGLASATGADVAASTDPTGATRLGGDWTLESHVGKIDTRELAIAQFDGVLENVAFDGNEVPYDYSNATITKTLGNGISITFQADQMGFDAGGLYPYTGNNSDTQLVITIQNGYSFDLSGFAVLSAGVNGQVINLTAINADGSANAGDSISVVNGIAGGTFGSASLPSMNDVRQIVIRSNDYISLQNFNITDVKLLPPTAVVTDAHLSSDTGNGKPGTDTDFITSTASQTIQGTLSTALGSGEKVQVSYDNGNTWNDAGAYSVGSTAWSTTTTLSGSNTFMARVSNVDASSTAYSHSYALDITAPTTTFSNIALSSDAGLSNTDFITNTASQTISATLSVAPAGTDIVWGSVDGGAHWTDITSKVSGTTLTWTGATLAAGGSLAFKVTDAAGNDSTPTTRSYTLDTTAPTTTFSNIALSNDTGTSNTDFITNTASQTISATLSVAPAGTDTVWGSVDGGAHWTDITSKVSGTTLTWTGAALTAGGSLAFKVTDAAGNDSTPTNRSYTLDTTAPTTTFSGLALSADTGSSTDFITKTAAQTVTATLSGALSGGDVLYGSLDNGSTWTDITSKVSGTSLSWNGVTLAGSSTLLLKVTDAAGNDGTVKSQAYTLDTSAPATPGTPVLAAASDSGASSSDAVTNDNTPTLSGTAENGSKVDIYDGATLLGSVTAGAGGWTFTTGVLSEGSHTITAVSTDTAGNASAASAGLTVVVDTAAPTVTSTSVPANATYNSGGTLDFTVNFDEAVLVDTSGGTPSIAIIVGGTTRFANYVSGSGTGALVFRYTVPQGDVDADGITVGALSVNGGTMRDQAGNNAVSTLNSVGSTAGVLVDGSNPGITGVSASTANGTYGAGQTVTLTVDFSTAVDVDTSGGTPTLTLGDGGIATYTGGTGTGTLTFSYTVGAGQNSADLDYGSTAAVALNGATIRDAGGSHQNADITLATPGAAGSLGANKDIVIDTTAPTNTVAGAAFSADTGTSGSDFITKTAAQTVSGTLASNLAADEHVYVSLDNGATWALATASAGASTWSLAGQTLTGSNTLKVRITDDAGNSGSAYTQAYVLDTTAPTIGFSGVAFSADTGTSASDLITNTSAQTISATLSSAPAAGDIVLGSLDNGATWTDITSKVSGTTLTWNGVTLAASDTLQLRVTDAAGNAGSVTSRAYVLDTTAPTTSVASVAFSADSGASNSDFITRTAAQTVSGTLSANLFAGETVLVSLDNGATWSAASTIVGSNTWSLAGQTLSASNTLLVKVSDAAGNDAAVLSQAYVFDTAATIPTVDALTTLDTAPTITGQATLAAGETMTVTVGGATYDVVPVAGNWSLDLATAVPVSGTLTLALNNRYSVVAAVTDLAGNVGTDTSANELTVGVIASVQTPTPPALPVETQTPPPVPLGVVNAPPLDIPQDAPAGNIGSAPPPPAWTSSFTPSVIALDSTTLATPMIPVDRPVFSESSDVLSVNVPIPDLALQSGGRFSYQIAGDAFSQSGGAADLSLSAFQADGKPLPGWLKFDARTGRFEGTPPIAFEGTLSFKVVAKDAQGHIAVQTFKVVVSKDGQAAKSASLSPDLAKPAGRASLGEQMHMARAADAQRLAVMARLHA